jgi:hypothetical protein
MKSLQDNHATRGLLRGRFKCSEAPLCFLNNNNIAFPKHACLYMYAWQRFTHSAINCAQRKQPAAAFSSHIFTLVWQPPRAVSHFNHPTDVWARVRSFIFHWRPVNFGLSEKRQGNPSLFMRTHAWENRICVLFSLPASIRSATMVPRTVILSPCVHTQGQFG